MSLADSPLFSDQDALAGFCRRNHIRRLALFGSTSRGDHRPDSDIDLLVEFECGRDPALIALAGLEQELTRLAGAGRPVELRTPSDLSRHFRDRVVDSAIVQYVA